MRTYHVEVNGVQWPNSETTDPGAAIEQSEYLMGEFPTRLVEVIETCPKEGRGVFWANDTVTGVPA